MNRIIPILTLLLLSLTAQAQVTVSGVWKQILPNTNTPAANQILAGPTNGSAAIPSWRLISTNDLPVSPVTPGVYTNSDIKVDAYGRVVAVTNGSAGSGGGGGSGTVTSVFITNSGPGITSTGPPITGSGVFTNTLSSSLQTLSSNNATNLSGFNPANLTNALKTNYVRRAGDTMTGLLVLSGAPVNTNGAATKQYVDDKTSLTNLTNTLGSTYGRPEDVLYRKQRISAFIHNGFSNGWQSLGDLPSTNIGTMSSVSAGSTFNASGQRWQSAATANSLAGFAGNLIYNVGGDFSLAAQVAIQSTNNIRWMLMFSDETFTNTVSQATNEANHSYVGFLWADDMGLANYQLVTGCCAGSLQFLDSGIPADTSHHMFEMEFTWPDGLLITFKIDKATVGTLTGGIPGATQMRVVCGARTLDNVAKAVDAEWLQVKTTD